MGRAITGGEREEAYSTVYNNKEDQIVSTPGGLAYIYAGVPLGVHVILNNPSSVYRDNVIRAILNLREGSEEREAITRQFPQIFGDQAGFLDGSLSDETQEI